MYFVFLDILQEFPINAVAILGGKKTKKLLLISVIQTAIDD